VDIQAYISSGILEAYLLDGLTVEERTEVEDMLMKYPELKLELEQIEESLKTLALQTSVKPADGLKDSILNAIEEEAEKGDTRLNPEAQTKDIQPKVVPINKNTSVWSYVAAASIALALISSFTAYNYYARWKAAESLYTALLDDSQMMANQYNQVNQRLDDLTNDLDVISNEDFQRVNMASVVEEQRFTASVFWNAKTREAYLNIVELKDLADNQQYQLWAIVDGQPVDMGVFDFDQEGLLKMKSVGNAATFAVTIKPKGGSVNPTLDAMQVAGNVG